ncbi:hypothetical protein SAY86_025638 [Trapa natans]|uniref:mRNA-decapping enzyme-like protein n=1 Tax=Trapa natans TaxID=22666 RepID=A0AAN7K9J0_TRANT|nr:hypothetical protein SAY86_025638 [Trapa natans]
MSNFSSGISGVAMSHSGKLMPNIDKQSTKLLNLTVLQRMDSLVEEILITAAHVTLYEFNIDSTQWSRKDIEGSLFVVKRNAQPRFQFIVMNRRSAGLCSMPFFDVIECTGIYSMERVRFDGYDLSGHTHKKKKLLSIELLRYFLTNVGSCQLLGSRSLQIMAIQHLPFTLYIRYFFASKVSEWLVSSDNLVENLLGDFEFEVQVPYLLYRNTVQEVNGIWFYNPRECEEVANLLGRILSAYSKVPQKPKISSTKSEFEELEAVPTLAAMDGPLEPSSSSASNVADVPDDPAFLNFFSSALNGRSAPITAVAGQPFQPASTGIFPPSLAPTIPSASVLPLKVPSTPLSAPAPQELPPDSTNSLSSKFTNLVKPSSFISIPSSSPVMVPPVSLSIPTAPLLHSHINLQRPYGALALQPFPPPIPPLSLSPPTVPNGNYGPIITRDKVREALLVLVQSISLSDTKWMLHALFEGQSIH